MKKIEINCDNYPILLTKIMINRIIDHINLSKRNNVKINIVELIEIPYIEYLWRVIYYNDEMLRELKLSSNGVNNKEVIYTVLQKQLQTLKTEDGNCFESVIIKSKGELERYYLFRCTRSFFGICHDYSIEIDLSNFS